MQLGCMSYMGCVVWCGVCTCVCACGHAHTSLCVDVHVRAMVLCAYLYECRLTKVYICTYICIIWCDSGKASATYVHMYHGCSSSGRQLSSSSGGTPCTAHMQFSVCSVVHRAHCVDIFPTMLNPGVRIQGAVVLLSWSASDVSQRVFLWPCHP